MGWLNLGGMSSISLTLITREVVDDRGGIPSAGAEAGLNDGGEAPEKQSRQKGQKAPHRP